MQQQMSHKLPEERCDALQGLGKELLPSPVKSQPRQGGGGRGQGWGTGRHPPHIVQGLAAGLHREDTEPLSEEQAQARPRARPLGRPGSGATFDPGNQWLHAAGETEAAWCSHKSMQLASCSHAECSHHTGFGRGWDRLPGGEATHRDLRNQ